MKKRDFYQCVAFCLLLFANFGYAADYAGCKSFCADKFRECIGVHKGISPEDCASISNSCLAQCKTLSSDNASNSNSGSNSGFWVFVIGLGLVGAIVMFLRSERRRQAKFEESSRIDRIKADYDKQFDERQAEYKKRIAEIENMTPEELAAEAAKIPTIKSLGNEVAGLTVDEISRRTVRSHSSVKAYLKFHKLSAKDYDPKTEEATPKPTDPNVPKRTRGPNKPKAGAGAGKKESDTKA